MKLFTGYNRINILVMGIVFLLFSGSFFFVLNFVLVHDLDKELVAARDRVQDYVNRYHALPADPQVGGVFATYELTTLAPGPSNFQLVEQFDPADGKKHNFRKLVYFLHLNENTYKVRLSIDLESRNRLSMVVAIVTVMSILVIIIGLLLANGIVLKRLWQPFYDTLAIIKNFDVGADQDIAFPKTNIDEFAFMIENLEAGTRRAREEYSILKQFTENASHELQTPLAIIRSKLDIMIQDEGLTEKHGEVLRSAYAALKKLSRLNQALLLLARIENRQFQKKKQVSLVRITIEKLEQFRELLNNSYIFVTTVYNDQAAIDINPELVDILINNLFSNAIRHNNLGGNIRIETDENRFLIANTGRPEPLDAQRLFHRFYKEPGQEQGVGLGLFISRRICDVCGLHIRYEYDGMYHVFVLTWQQTL